MLKPIMKPYVICIVIACIFCVFIQVSDGYHTQDNVRRGRAAVKKIGTGTHRVWSNGEENVLIAALKHLVAHGWKTDNGFRTGYLNKLEDAIRKVYPHIDLVVTWRKAYGSLVSAQRDTTGVG